MRLSLFTASVVALYLTVPAAIPAGGGMADDVKQLQGTWVIDPATYKDIKDAGALKDMKAVRVIFVGKQVTFKHPPGNEERGPFLIDSSKTPKEIDLLGPMGNPQAQGIYELEKGKLKLCWDREFKKRGRPSRFVVDKNSDEPFLLVLVRIEK